MFCKSEFTSNGFIPKDLLTDEIITKFVKHSGEETSFVAI
jgi:hypothetical protein